MESELDEDDEPISIVDGRPSLLLSDMYLLAWGDISLTAFPPSFLSPSLTPVQQITYMDLSNNLLSWVPLEVFQLPNVISLNLSHNQLMQVPHPDRWSPSSIHILNLSHNLLGSNDGNHTPQVCHLPLEHELTLHPTGLVGKTKDLLWMIAGLS